MNGRVFSASLLIIFQLMSAKTIIESLQLQKHPEGGYYKEIYRSSQIVRNEKNEPRSASTSIYFLLEQGDFSAWHSLQSDEIWHFYQGSEVKIYIYQNQTLTTQILGPSQFQVLLPKHSIFAAEPTGEYSLMGCTVSPGFEFSDFQLFSFAQLHELLPSADKQLLKRLARE